MRPISSRLIAALSCCLAATAIEAARRPNYGGSLRVEMRAAPGSLDPADVPADPAEATGKAKLTTQIFETLVDIDANGEACPRLAVSWTHDPAHKRWVFTIRPGVVLHDGTKWDPPGGIVAVEDKQPIDDILRDLAKPRSAIAVRGTNGALLGTGPFKISAWDPKKQLTLEAHEAYWGGRPYLDAVEVQLGRNLRDQALDFDLGKSDVIEIQPAEVRRIQQKGGRTAESAPIQLLALQLDPNRQELERVREALALCIDRASINTVLFQKQGIISGGLLPQWLTGYAFLFPTVRDLPKAKEAAGPGRKLSFAYDPQSPVLRAVAERIALNAADAGIELRPATGVQADVRLISLRVSSLDPKQALIGMAAALQTESRPVHLFETEQALIRSRAVIPLFHLPAAYQLSPRVQSWSSSKSMLIDHWNLADVWLSTK